MSGPAPFTARYDRESDVLYLGTAPMPEHRADEGARGIARRRDLDTGDLVGVSVDPFWPWRNRIGTLAWVLARNGGPDKAVLRDLISAATAPV